MIEKPSLKNLTSTTYGKPSPNQNEFLQSLGEPHVSSFNYMLAQGLQQAIDNLTPAQFKIGEKQVKILIKTAYILPPAVPAGTAGVRSHLIYPTECRQRGSSYTGSLHVLVDWFIDGRPQPTQDYAVGQVPIMVKVIAIVNLNDQLTAEPGCVRDSTADDTWCSIIFGCLKVFVAIGLLYGVYTLQVYMWLSWSTASTRKWKNTKLNRDLICRPILWMVLRYLVAY
ncbi:DNA-directed RNA polymerase I subunit RPA2-like isoform X2 [Macrosteles quadrilineatus]|uniref:DNA-directed RNA polymerase I subunit RPA2-like isoform X2 n=1 Tax=Macrosteles quadrilineatus TaxID=74068 RepID=UPI0023E1256E|nr:DNA-directed RNA polymerase I subunit RPA2-like isoform X2 [Macrosteles quadrilineatus]